MANSSHEMIRSNKSLDIEAYKVLLSNGPMTAEKLGEILNGERSTAYRSLQNLLTCGIIYREVRSIESGGYYYEYVAIEPQETRKMVKKTVDEWYNRMHEQIEKIG